MGTSQNLWRYYTFCKWSLQHTFWAGAASVQRSKVWILYNLLSITKVSVKGHDGSGSRLLLVLEGIGEPFVNSNTKCPHLWTYLLWNTKGWPIGTPYSLASWRTARDPANANECPTGNPGKSMASALETVAAAFVSSIFVRSIIY